MLDVALAAAFVALTVAEAITVEAPSQTTRLLLLSAPALATLGVRRQYPLLVATVVANVNFLVNTENEFTTLLSLVLVAFTTGYETRPPRHYLGLALVVVPFLANLARADRRDGRDVADPARRTA